jgi:hypothetical protein
MTSGNNQCASLYSLPARSSAVSHLANISRCFLVLSSLSTLMVTFCNPSYAQQGQNAVYNAAGTAPTPSPSFLDATQFTGSPDACVQIQHAFAALPATGGTVDARGLAGTSSTLTCSVNPIPTGAKGRLLLSTGTYLAQVPWVIQSNDINIIGTGASDNTGSNNTIVQACASGQTGCGGVVFSSGKAVIQMGTSTSTVFRSTVKEVAVDWVAGPPFTVKVGT